MTEFKTGVVNPKCRQIFVAPRTIDSDALTTSGMSVCLFSIELCSD